jgi:hypothetical protein
MISLDLTHEVILDQTKLFLVKGRTITTCHACKKSVYRMTAFRCNECRHDFCAGCVASCRCQSRGFRVNLSFWKRQTATGTHQRLAIVR